MMNEEKGREVRHIHNGTRGTVARIVRSAVAAEREMYLQDGKRGEKFAGSSDDWEIVAPWDTGTIAAKAS